MLRCIECGIESESGRGWRTYLGYDPSEDDYPEAVTYCAECAEREFDPRTPASEPEA